MSSDVPVRRSILRAPGQPPRNTPAVIQFQHDRKDYVIKVYVWATIFVCLSTVQWITIALDHHIREYFEENTFISFVGAFSTLLLLTIFALFSDLRFNPSVNRIFAICVVECATFGMVQLIVNIDFGTLAICFLLTTAVTIGLSVIGALLPLDITEYILPIIVVSFIFYLTITFALLLSLITGMYFPRWLFYSVIIVLLIVYIMYNAQLISGTRTGMLRWRDFILPALMVYFTFSVMFLIVTSITMEDPTFNFGYEYKFKGNWPFD